MFVVNAIENIRVKNETTYDSCRYCSNSKCEQCGKILYFGLSNCGYRIIAKVIKRKAQRIKK